jgi:hypothetical protein
VGHDRLLQLPVWLSLMLLVFVGSSGVTLAQQKPEGLAQQSSDAWLALTDQGKYADGYQEAAQYFKNAVTKDQWESAMHASREPFGKVLSRKLKSAKYTKMLPGAPDGEYVVIQYDSSLSTLGKRVSSSC